MVVTKVRNVFGLLLFAALFIALSSSTVMAQSESTTFTVTATVVTPLTIARTADLAFGSFARVSSGAGGTVTINPATDGRSFTGDITLVTTAPGSRATFTVTGTTGLAYTVTLPADGATNLVNGVNTMAINFTQSGNDSLSAGSDEIYVGGTITVAAAQAAAAYTALNVPISVAYD